MLKTYIWMAIFLGINGIGFVFFLIRTSRIEAEQARRQKDEDEAQNGEGS
ncbi:MAG: hypothetical protein JXE07_01340 [Candidatus Aminicenantes bacterium]|nr:hypothetical protein [Candidatus Aminicenantes bacterium]